MNGPMGQLLGDHKRRAARTLIAHHSTVELTALMAVSRPPIDQRGPARAGCQQGSVAQREKKAPSPGRAQGVFGENIGIDHLM
jgi:hypothetical protein